MTAHLHTVWVGAVVVRGIDDAHSQPEHAALHGIELGETGGGCHRVRRLGPVHPADAFAALVQGPEEALADHLDEAALLVAAACRPELDPGPTMDALDALAAACPAADAGGLARWLFWSEGFSGNADDYYDPANSWLDQVVARRTGIPITLSLVMIEVGRRIGIALDGIGMPGHFLVGTRTDPPEIFDPFSGGIKLDAAACESRLRASVGPSAALHPGYLAPVSPRQLLHRMANNLRQVHLRRNELPKLAAIMRVLCSFPGAPSESHLELAGVLAQLGDFGVAADVLDGLTPRASADARPRLRAKAAGLRARLN